MQVVVSVTMSVPMSVIFQILELLTQLKTCLENVFRAPCNIYAYTSFQTSSVILKPLGHLGLFLYYLGMLEISILANLKDKGLKRNSFQTTSTILKPHGSLHEICKTKFSALIPMLLSIKVETHRAPV